MHLCITVLPLSDGRYGSVLLWKQPLAKCCAWATPLLCADDCVMMAGTKTREVFHKKGAGGRVYDVPCKKINART